MQDLGNNYVIEKNDDEDKISTLFKNKDVNRVIKGGAEVEIINPDGTIATVAKTENLLTNSFIFDMFYMQILNKQGLFRFPHFVDFPLSFGSIFLTDWKEEEDAENTELLGNVVGFADVRTPVQTLNPLQGTAVVTLTNQDQFNMHFMVEFPPEKGNGKFQTIWFTTAFYNPSSPKNVGLPYQTKPQEFLEGSFKSANPKITVDKNGKIIEMTDDYLYIYSIIDMGIRKSLKLEKTIDIASYNINQCYSIAYAEENNELWLCCQFLDIDKNNIYVLDADNYSLKDKVKLEIDGAGNLALVCYKDRVFALKKANYGILIKPILIGEKKFETVVVGQKEIEQLNKETNQMEKITVDVMADKKFEFTFERYGEQAYNIAISKDLCFVGSGDAEYVFKISDKKFVDEAGKEDPAVLNLELLTIAESNVNTHYKCSLNSRYGEHCFIAETCAIYRAYVEPFTQTLLASPITKNAGQTARITYSFTFDTSK